MNLISGIDVTAGALNANKTRLDIVAQNIANAQTTRTPEGGPYRRKVVTFENELLKREGAAPVQTVRVGSVLSDKSPGQQVYNPQHPDAGPDGLVTMPNVNLSFEMVDLITASRSYEANLNMISATRKMLAQTLGILK
mgnify:CR=1 FL=1